MTGMWNFNFSLCLLSIATFAGAAEISFVGDNKLSGELITMDSDGTVTLKTPYATEPLKIKPEGIVKIDFNKSSNSSELPQQKLTLINGDSFPVDVQSLDDKAMKISSPTLGELSIPREIISSLDVGTFFKKSIYKGPGQISDWSNIIDQATQWEVEDNKLFTQGSGTIYRDVKLPENYSVRFKVSWETMPNFRFYFSDPMTSDGNNKVNRYYLQFNRAGMEIKRESTGRQSWLNIATIEREPQEFVSKDVWIELRVNRKSGLIELYLNDRLQGKHTDTNPNIPSGTGISFFAIASVENKISVSNIEISQWEDRGDNRLTEDRGDTKEDALIGKNGERFGGRIISIASGDNGKTFRFKSNFQADPIDLPSSEVSSVFFAAAPNVKSKEFNGMRLYFQGQGDIQVSKCVFADETINITHPLLGDLQLNSNAVSRLERSDSTQTKTSKSK